MEKNSSEKCVEILGLYPPSFLKFEGTPGYELWTLNAWYAVLGCPPLVPTRVYQLHRPGRMLPAIYGTNWLDLDRVHAAYARWGVRVFTLPECQEEFPLCQAAGNLRTVDVQSLYDLFAFSHEPRAFLFCSSIAYMLAHAVLEGFTKIRIRGCSMRSEYQYELPGIWRMIQLLSTIPTNPPIHLDVEFGKEWQEKMDAHPKYTEEAKRVLQQCYIDLPLIIRNHQAYDPLRDPRYNGRLLEAQEEWRETHRIAETSGEGEKD